MTRRLRHCGLSDGRNCRPHPLTLFLTDHEKLIAHSKSSSCPIIPSQKLNTANHRNPIFQETAVYFFSQKTSNWSLDLCYLDMKRYCHLASGINLSGCDMSLIYYVEFAGIHTDPFLRFGGNRIPKLDVRSDDRTSQTGGLSGCRSCSPHSLLRSGRIRFIQLFIQSSLSGA